MASRTNPDSPFFSATIYGLYRDFFDQAERRRRWRVKEDIPWSQCNPRVNPAAAEVVESFCAVELYLPDYLGKILPHIRASRGRAWFTANWGYEESKHSPVPSCSAQMPRRIVILAFFRPVSIFVGDMMISSLSAVISMRRSRLSLQRRRS